MSMRNPETEALLRKLLRSNRGLGISEAHTQLACRQFLIEHMDILAEEGVKFMRSEMLIDPDYLDAYVGPYDRDTQIQLLKTDMKSMLCQLYPTADYQNEIKPWAEAWHAKDQEKLPMKIDTLDALFADFQAHPYTAKHLFESAEAHGIAFIGTNVSGEHRYQIMRDQAEKNLDEGKVVFLAGARHIGEDAANPQGICKALGIPSFGVFDGPESTPSIVIEGRIRWLAAEQQPIAHDYIIQRAPMPVKGIDTPPFKSPYEISQSRHTALRASRDSNTARSGR